MRPLPRNELGSEPGEYHGSRWRGERAARALKSAGMRPSKARGQNFLVQPAIASQIVRALEIKAGDKVIEIGPGLGILTARILDARPQSLTLVELDRRLAAMLEARFGANSRVKLLNRDFLTLSRLEFEGDNLKIVGNLPFNAAAAILRHLCEYSASIGRMVLMFQREVGERIRALPGSSNYGALSVFAALYWRVGGHFRVAAGSFHPRPKVDGEVLILEPRRERGFDTAEEPDIRTTIRAAFSAPRKTIRNSLAGGLGLESSVIKAALAAANIEPDIRPALLAPPQLISLARIMRPATACACRA